MGLRIYFKRYDKSLKSGKLIRTDCPFKDNVWMPALMYHFAVSPGCLKYRQKILLTYNNFRRYKLMYIVIFEERPK